MNKTNKQLLYFMLAMVVGVGLYRLYLWLPDYGILASTKSTEHWKTYMNTKYGFSFRYPPRWKVHEEPQKKYTTQKGDLFVHEDQIFVWPPQSGNMARNTGGMIIDFVKDQSYIDAVKTSTKPLLSTITLGGYPGTLAIYTSNTTQSYDIRTPNSTGQFHFMNPPQGWSKDATITLQPLYNGSIDVQKKILETITFTKSNE